MQAANAIALGHASSAPVDWSPLLIAVGYSFFSCTGRGGCSGRGFGKDVAKRLRLIERSPKVKACSRRKLYWGVLAVEINPRGND